MSIQYADGLIVACESVLRGWHGKLSLTKKPNSRSQPVALFYSEIDTTCSVDTYEEEVTNDKRALPILPILPLRPLLSSTDTFYFGARFRFDYEMESKFLLTSIGLSIFLAPGFQPLFRAEWDRRDVESKSSDHAQPHWHLFGAMSPINPVDAGEAGGSAKSAKPFTGTDVSPSPVKRIHFPMAASWHVGVPKIKHELPDRDSVVSWLRGLMDYTRDQLKYVTEKVDAAGGAAPAKEFR